MAEPQLDVITIGRSSVDLYGQQIGGRLEDMASFSKAVGGCPANIAIGAARLGLKSALLTRVGDEHMGRFIREQCAREGVDVRGVRTDPQRLTALVVLGVRDEKSFPLIFYRDNCADAALDESDVDEDFIASAKAIVVTGTHFAKPNTEAAQRKAIAVAKTHGRKVAFDIDYRPNLWGLAGHGAGEERYLKSDAVSAHLKTVLPFCDLIVGTEEEVMIAGGGDDPLAALRAIRAVSAALIVMKRGPMGCVVYPGAIPDRIEDGVKGPGFPVEVYNVLGAGDAFMAGFLRGWLRGEALERCCAFANAGGAFAVSRLLCAPEYADLARDERIPGARLRASARCARTSNLKNIHWSTTRENVAETHHGAGDRPSRAAWRRSPPTPAPSAENPRLQAPGRRGRGARRRRQAGLRHAARRQIWPRGSVPRRRAQLLDRPSDRGAGLAAARFRVRRLAWRAAGGMAEAPRRQVPLLLPSG